MAGRREAYERWKEKGTTAPPVAVPPPSKDTTVWPTASARITQGSKEGHVALDFGGNIGDPIFATKAGTVVNVRSGTTGYGLNIILRSTNGLYETVYAHLSGVNVKVGQQVRAGQQIGALGATGTKDPHLHYEERRAGLPEIFNGAWSATSAIDPKSFLGLTSTIPQQDNGRVRAGVGINLPVIGRVGVGAAADPTELFTLQVPLFSDVKEILFPSPGRRAALKEAGMATFPISMLTMGVGVVLVIIGIWLMFGPSSKQVAAAGKKAAKVAAKVAVA